MWIWVPADPSCLDWVFFERTVLGKAFRACAVNRRAAQWWRESGTDVVSSFV